MSRMSETTERKGGAKTVVPVILAGGAGRRLWPLSRAEDPKPFQRLFGGRSLLQATVARAAGITDRPPLVVCNEAHRFLVAEQLRSAVPRPLAIVLEPEPRPTSGGISDGF